MGGDTEQGRAVQVAPMKPKLKPPGTKCLKLNCDMLLSTSAFEFNLRRYNKGFFGPRKKRPKVGTPEFIWEDDEVVEPVVVEPVGPPHYLSMKALDSVS